MFIIDIYLKTIISILNICLEKVRWIYQRWMNINHGDSSNTNKLLIHSPTWTISSGICTVDGENIGKCTLNDIYFYIYIFFSRFIVLIIFCCDLQENN